MSAVLWGAFVAITVAGGIALLRACGLLLPSLGWNFCPMTPAALSAEAARGTTLSMEVRQLELELALKDLACASIPPPPPPFELPTHAGKARPQQTAQLKPPPPPPMPSEFDKRLEEAKAKTGELQISLFWEGPDDLDLHVVCPNGDIIDYGRKSGCGGALDVDVGPGGFPTRPAVENIFWPPSQAPKGHFKVYVRRISYALDPRPAIPFKVRIKDGGRERVFSAMTGARYAYVTVTEFNR